MFKIKSQNIWPYTLSPVSICSPKPIRRADASLNPHETQSQHQRLIFVNANVSISKRPAIFKHHTICYAYGTKKYGASPFVEFAYEWPESASNEQNRLKLNVLDEWTAGNINLRLTSSSYLLSPLQFVTFAWMKIWQRPNPPFKHNSRG